MFRAFLVWTRVCAAVVRFNGSDWWRAARCRLQHRVGRERGMHREGVAQQECRVVWGCMPDGHDWLWGDGIMVGWGARRVTDESDQVHRIRWVQSQTGRNVGLLF